MPGHPIDTLEAAAAMLRNARRPVIFTGAGMSVDSGVPAFRGRQGGLWSEFDPQRLATPAAYRADRDLVWGWYVWRMALVARAQPHAGHVALAGLQARWPELAIVTQNVDDLHERAGSRHVLHLHGEIFALRCFACGRPHHGYELPAHAADGPQLRLPPPSCAHCGGPVRPGVVWFGESLPQDIWQQALQPVRDADVLLVVGTSGVVEPAASLVGQAQSNGARVIEVNPEPSTQSARADIHLRGSAADMLPRLFGG